MAKSKNLKTKSTFNWHELIDKKFVAIYIALALVLVINQIVFSVILTDRDQARADTVVFGNDVVGDINYPELTDQMATILPPADRNPNVLVVDEINGFAYIGTNETGFGTKIIQVNLTDYRRVAELTFSGLGNVQTAIIDNTSTYAYFSFYTSPPTVKKIKLSDFTVEDTLTLPGNNNYLSAIDDNYVYFAPTIFTGAFWEACLVRIDLSTFTLPDPDYTTSPDILQTGGRRLRAAVIDGSIGYFGDASTGGADTAQIYKVDLSTFTLVGADTLTLTAWSQNVSLNGMDFNGTDLWVSNQNYPASLLKIDTTTNPMTIAEVIDYESTTEAWTVPPDTFPALYVDNVLGMKIDNGNAYLSVQPFFDPNWPTNILLEVDLTLGDVTALPLNKLTATSSLSTAFDIDLTTHKAYVSDSNYPAFVEKVDFATFTREAVLDLPVTLDQSRASVIDTNNGYMYTAGWVDPPQIARINLYDFTLDRVLTLDSTLYTQPYSAAIDMEDGYAYFGVTQTAGGGWTGLLKVDIDPARSFAVVDFLDLTGYVFVPNGQMLIDPGNDLLYWANASGDDVLKINVATMVVADTLTLTDSISYGNIAGVIDLDNQYAYYAVNDIADNHGRIVRIELDDFLVADVVEIDLSAEADEKQFVSAVIDTTNDFAYFRSLWGPVVKISTDPDDLDFSDNRVGAITIPTWTVGQVTGYAGIDTSLGVAFFASGDKINKIDVDPANTFALLNQVDITDTGDILIDPVAGFLYLVTKELTPIGIKKYSYTLAGFMYAYKVTVTDPIASVDYFRFYSNIADGSFIVGLYDSATPKNRLWQSNDIVNTVAGDWIDIPVSSGTPATLTNLPAGDYYLAFQANSSEPVASQISGGDGFKILNDYGSLPLNVGGETPTSTSWSIYAAFVTTISGGGTYALGAPTDFACQVINDNTIRWNFMDNSYDEIGFRLYDNQGRIAEINSQQGIEQYYIDETDLTPGTLYENRYVVAYNDTGESEPSNLATCTTTTTVGGGGALPVGFDIGDLLKTPDVTTVYVINSDYKRHPFPNEATYFSWYPDFSPIKIISMNDLSTIAIGSNVTVRPGTNLIKIQSVNKVYAVEPVGAIRWIETADTAVRLYGENWAGRVIDISPAFFMDYTESYPVAEDMHPTGSLIRYLGGANVYYIDSGIKRLVISEQFTRSNYQEKYILTGLSADLTYPTGETMTDKTIIGYLE